MDDPRLSAYKPGSYWLEDAFIELMFINGFSDTPGDTAV